ncbi:MAG: UDP-glucose 4-epimerase GalE [Thermoguttaceae bacterium]
MKILVTGGAGFIGSVVTEQLAEQGHDVVVLDNLKYGFQAAVHPKANFVRGDILDRRLLDQVLKEREIEAVAHLAAEAFIDDSVRDPALFYHTNMTGGLCLLDAMIHAGVKRLVFSSTAAVYGQPERVPIPEDAPKIPCNSYGDSKLAFEGALAWYRAAYALKYVSLRYFNACGATERSGESRKRETHLIPIALAAALGQRDGLNLFGTDYDTPDGTCIRDYIHVADIARAHVLALDAMDQLGARVYNLGTSEGNSNLEVIRTVKQVTGRDFPVRNADRRPGDPPRLVAQATRIRQELGWQPAYPELHTMVETAWKWKISHPGGYTQ